MFKHPRGIAAAVLCSGLALSEAHGSAYFIRAETQAQAYQIRSYRQTDAANPELLPRRRIVQSLGLDVFEIVTGEDFGFESDLRLWAELGLPREDADKIDGLHNEDADLLDASLKYARGGFAAQLGRQLYGDTMDVLAFDGLRLRYLSPFGVGAEAYAGLWVKGAGFLGSSVYQPDGTRETDAIRLAAGVPLAEPALDDLEPLFGAKLLAANLWGFSGAFGYRRAMVAGKVDLERATAELRYGNGRGLNGFAGLDFDLFLTQVAQARAQLRWDGEVFSASAEALRLSPVFSSDSIWMYFAYAPRDEVRVGAELHPAGPLRLYAQGIGSLYHQRVNENIALSLAVDAPGAPSPYNYGGTAGASADLHPFRLAASVLYRNGYGGNQLWGDLTAGWAQKGSPLTLDARLSIADVQDQWNPLLRGTFYGVQAWGGYAITPQAKASVVLEENVNPFTRSDFKVFVLFDFQAAIG